MLALGMRAGVSAAGHVTLSESAQEFQVFQYVASMIQLVSRNDVCERS